jgi:Putative zinc-finger
MTEPNVCVVGEPSPFSLERLSAYLDGDLAAVETQSVRQHLEACPTCARRSHELGVVARAARGLEAPEPPATLWLAIEGELARQEGVASRGVAARWWMFGLGAFAGAAVAIVVGVGWTRAPAPTASTDVGVVAAPVDPLLLEAEQEFERAAGVYEHSIEKLRALLVREQSGWSPDTRTRYDERLARLDEAITRSREAARRTPADSVGNEELFAAYQHKLAFLTETVHRGGGWGPGAP